MPLLGIREPFGQDVPDPVHPQSARAIGKVTTTAICGSPHLYNVTSRDAKGRWARPRVMAKSLRSGRNNAHQSRRPCGRASPSACATAISSGGYCGRCCDNSNPMLGAENFMAVRIRTVRSRMYGATREGRRNSSRSVADIGPLKALPNHRRAVLFLWHLPTCYWRPPTARSSPVTQWPSGLRPAQFAIKSAYSWRRSSDRDRPFQGRLELASTYGRPAMNYKVDVLTRLI